MTETGADSSPPSEASVDLEPETAPRQPFVIALGASAGGVGALQSVLPHLPFADDVAIVIAQHGLATPDGHGASALNAGRSGPDVHVPEPGDPIEGGRVYLMAIDQHVRFEEGKLSFAAGETSSHERPSIDQLFMALAQALGLRLAAVVLSGSGRDGMRGLRTVRAGGGFTIAQDPESAKFDGMPCAAISAGCVDLVLEPGAIGAEIGRVFQRIRSGLLSDGEETQALDRLLAAVKDQAGLDFRSYKRPSLLRRIRRRVALSGKSDLRSYTRYAEERPPEFTLLARDILISVTSFFRDPDAFLAFGQAVERRLAEKGPDEPIRVWVPACATGEEAYSVGIVVAEALKARTGAVNVVVYGTDVDTEAVEYARRGVYAAVAGRSIPPDLLDRYFWRDEATLTVKKSLREQMVFAVQDVVNDPPFSHLDFIACRNLLIYLRPPAQADVLRLFHYALQPGGILFLGKSESLGLLDGAFDALDKRQRVFRRKDGALSDGRADSRSNPGLGPAPAGSGRSRLSRVPRAHAGPHPSLRDGVAHALADHLGAPAVLVDGRRDILYVRGDVTDFLNVQEGDGGMTVVDLAVSSLRPALRSALHRAGRDGGAVTKERVRVKAKSGEPRLVDIDVLPAYAFTGRNDAVLVVFRSRAEPADDAAPPSDNGRERELERDLAAAHESLDDVLAELESTNEELRSLNQELHASNEELQSTNEELETANEELQATNEELTTVNEALRSKTIELESANAELDNVLTRIAHPLVVVDEDLRIRKLSAAARRAFDLPDSSAGMELSVVAHHPVLKQLASDVEAVIVGHDARTKEIEHAGRYFLCEVQPFLREDGHRSGALLLVRDMTETRRRAREFETLAENAPDIIARFDRDLRHLYVNRTLERFTGRPRTDWIGKRNRDLGLDAEFVAPLERAIQSVFDGGESITQSFTFETPDGERHLQARFVPELASDGGVVSVMTVTRDVTAEVTASRALAFEKARIDSLLQSISDGFFSLDRDLVVTYFNAPAGRLLGRDPETVRGRPLFDAFPEAKGSMFEHRYRRAIETREPDAFETFFEPYDDWYDVRVYPSADGISVFFQVVSDQKRRELEQAQLEREFHHAQKMQALGTLSGGVAHEFNNLLMAILGFTELVRARPDLTPESAEDLDEVVVAVQRGRSLVDQILAFSRKSPATQRPAQLNDAVNRVLRILDGTLPRRIAVDAQLGPQLPAIVGDPGQLEQVVLNLTANAQDAISGSGTIFVTTSAEEVPGGRVSVGGDIPAGWYVVLRVSDDGAGMSEETQARIFDPFFTTKEPGAGTGLGLSTVYGIVKAHHGHIVCRSEPSRGTTFEVYFPALQTSSPTATPASERTTSEADLSGRNELILVADDETTLQHYYQRVLERAGYRVVLAGTGEQAQGLVDTYRDHIALAILDLGMPGQGGLETLRALRAAGHLMPVVVATGYASPEDAASARAAGARAVLRKPFDRRDLLELVRELLTETR